jgi:hypothetical protein
VPAALDDAPPVDESPAPNTRRADEPPHDSPAPDGEFPRRHGHLLVPMNRQWRALNGTVPTGVTQSVITSPCVVRAHAPVTDSEHPRSITVSGDGVAIICDGFHIARRRALLTPVAHRCVFPPTCNRFSPSDQGLSTHIGSTWWEGDGRGHAAGRNGVRIFEHQSHQAPAPSPSHSCMESRVIRHVPCSGTETGVPDLTVGLRHLPGLGVQVKFQLQDQEIAPFHARGRTLVL